MGLARTLNAGKVQGWVAPEGAGVVAVQGSSSVGVGYPNIEGGVRVGLTDHFELGGKLGLSGITVDGKIGLIRSASMDQGFNLSIDPGIGFIGFGTGASAGGASGGAFIGTVSFHLPVLFGIDFAGHELVIGPRLSDQFVFSGSGSSSATANFFAVGGSVGFAIRLGRSFRILPEVAVSVPVVASAGISGLGAVSGAGFGGFLIQGGIGFLFGSADAYESEEPPPPPPLPAPSY